MSSVAQISEEAKAEHESALAKLHKLNKEKEWLEDRRTRFTVSEYVRLMGYEDNPDYETKLTKGGISYAYEKYLEEISTFSKSFSTASTEHGNEFEVDAAVRFMDETGLKVHNYGDDQEFIKLGKDLGCTPDGLIEDWAGLETKCPDSKTQDQYLNDIKDQESFKEVCKKYYWQIMGSMYITGRKSWYFVSYDPRMKNEEEQILILRIDRNEDDIEKLKNRLRMAIGYKISLLKKRAKRKPLRLV